VSNDERTTPATADSALGAAAPASPRQAKATGAARANGGKLVPPVENRATRGGSASRPIQDFHAVPSAPPAVTPSAAAPAQTLSDDRYFNRELSWQDFNARVLALAEDESQPLLERAKFLAIFASN
jgi:polyphosphate kinase